MARSAPTRSQGAQPSQSQSQSQSQPSQSQRAPRGTQGRRRGRAQEDEDEEEQEEDAMEEDEDEDGGNDLKRKANDLVRLALFYEQKRMPLRRDEIGKKVLGSKSRKFQEVFAAAQVILKETFGMELVELVRTEEGDKKDTDAVGMKKKVTSTGLKSWILRSTLDPGLIEIASTPDEDILKVENEDAKDNDADDGASTNSGMILAWQNSDQLSHVGVLYIILTLVLVHGRAIADADLRRLLKRLRLPLSADMPSNARSTSHTTVEQFLNQCSRQGYLERHRIGDTKGAKKRVRMPAASQRNNNEEEMNMFEWRWGPRAMAEVGEVNIAKNVAQFMVETSQLGDDDEEMSDASRLKFMEAMMKGIERAGGGNLLDSR